MAYDYYFLREIGLGTKGAKNKGQNDACFGVAAGEFFKAEKGNYTRFCLVSTCAQSFYPLEKSKKRI